VDRLPFAAGSTIVGLGDSITDDQQSWIELLRCLVESRRPQDNIRFVNGGISGDTTTHLIFRFGAVIAENPAWIICMIGTNDTTRHGKDPLDMLISAQETEKNLKLLRHYAAMQTTAKWVWITPYGVISEKMSSHWFVSTLPLVIRNEDIDAAAEAVRRQPDPVVDLQKALGLPVNPDYMLDDGLHPSLEGQKAIVRALVETLT
jgi:lysophospholipase L1-like esterase